MRSVLPLALVLFVLAVLFERSEQLFPRRGTAAGADEALEIVAAAKGPLLPAGRLGSGPERIAEAIRIGDRTLVLEAPRSGLRSALLSDAGVLESQRCFELASAPEDARALRELVERAELESVLVLASSGWIAPRGPWAPAARQELAATLGALGARARPFEHAPESWALIALRRPGGWIPLVEGYSEDSGVVLAFSLGSGREELPPADFVSPRADGEVRVFLEGELQHASRRDPGIALARDLVVAGRSLNGILQPPRPPRPDEGHASASSLAWSDVPLRQGAGFVAWVGVADAAWERSDGVVFELRVDGELVLARAVGPDESDGAHGRAFQADLRPFAGRTVELELRVDPRGSSGGDQALWGRPVLVSGFDRPPLEVWAESR